MKMQAPLEVGLCCEDLDSLARFYVDVLGFRLVNVLTVPAAKARAARLSDGDYRVARLQTPYGERIKLLEPASRPGYEAPPDTLLARRNSAYLTFIVADLRAMLAKLRGSGVAILTGTDPVEVRPGTYLAFLRDPEGNVLEFVEYADIREYRTDLPVR